MRDEAETREKRVAAAAFRDAARLAHGRACAHDAHAHAGNEPAVHRGCSISLTEHARQLERLADDLDRAASGAP